MSFTTAVPTEAPCYWETTWVCFLSSCSAQVTCLVGLGYLPTGRLDGECPPFLSVCHRILSGRKPLSPQLFPYHMDVPQVPFAPLSWACFTCYIKTKTSTCIFQWVEAIADNLLMKAKSLLVFFWGLWGTYVEPPPSFSLFKVWRLCWVMNLRHCMTIESDLILHPCTMEERFEEGY